MVVATSGFHGQRENEKENRKQAERARIKMLSEIDPLGNKLNFSFSVAVFPVARFQSTPSPQNNVGEDPDSLLFFV